jgi:carboxyl-terminal processing protease
MTSNTKKAGIVVLVVVLVALSFFGGLKAGQNGYTFQPNGFKLINQSSQPKNVDYNLLWQTLDLINSDYIDKPVDQQKLLYGAVAGMVAAVGDPYTTFFDPTSYQSFKTELSGNFDGIGAEVGIKDNEITIIAPLDPSPAKQAGLLPGDIITKINGADATSDTLDQAVDLIRGPKGSTVTLEIYRDSVKKTMDFSIVRDTIAVPSVAYSTKNDNGKMVEYINVKDFGDDTESLFAQAATDAENKKATGIIIDLRDDGGGYLDAAVNLASYWVTPGDNIVTEKHSDGTSIQYPAKGNAEFKSIPTIILINGGSASASEILSGALHDYGFAKLVGEKSFGKGSVQELIPLPYNTALKVTVAKWYTPKGVNINHDGLNPDIPVTRTTDQIQNGQDPQLDKALDLLK